MSAKTKKNTGKDPSTTEADKSNRILLESKEWIDPKGRKVIGEYHKGSHNTNGIENNQPQEKKADTPTQKPSLQRIIDVSTIELMAYTLSRALFHQGVRVPLYIKGAVDMDIAVKDTQVIVNTNDVSFEPPPLQIWHIIFTYKGKPVLEYGHGVKNTMKIHHGHAILFLMAMWLGSRKRRKAREKATLDACMDLAKNPPEKIEKMDEKKNTGD
jgi:hypothetical protein